MVRTSIGAIALLVILQGAVRAQSLDAREGPALGGKGFAPGSAEFADKNDPGSMIVVAWHSDNWFLKWFNPPADFYVSSKKTSDVHKQFGVPAVDVKEIGTVNGAPAAVMPRYDGAAFDPGHGGTDAEGWIDNVNEKSLASLDQIEKGVKAMQAQGYAVGLRHLLIEKDGTVRVLSACEAEPAKVVGDGIGPPPPPRSGVLSTDEQENKRLLDGLRDGTRLVLAAEKAGIPRAELKKIDADLRAMQSRPGDLRPGRRPGRARAGPRGLRSTDGATREGGRSHAPAPARDGRGDRRDLPRAPLLRGEDARYDRRVRQDPLRRRAAARHATRPTRGSPRARPPRRASPRGRPRRARARSAPRPR